MKQIGRKLRGAQRVVALQADVLRLRAQAEAIDATVKTLHYSFWAPETPEQASLGVAWEAAYRAMAELYSFSPKRALALAARLGDIGPSFIARLYEGGKPDKVTRRVNRGWNQWKHEASARGLPLGTSKADQRKLKKARDAAQRAAKAR